MGVFLRGGKRALAGWLTGETRIGIDIVRMRTIGVIVVLAVCAEERRCVMLPTRHHVRSIGKLLKWEMEIY